MQSSKLDFKFLKCTQFHFASGISTISTASNPLLDSQMLQHEQPQHVEIVLNDDNDDAEQIAAEKENEQHTVKKVRHRRHKRPFYRRVFNYLRTAWTGVHFTSSNGKSLPYFLYSQLHNTHKSIFVLFFASFRIFFFPIISFT